MEPSVARRREIDGVFAAALDLAPAEQLALLARIERTDAELAGEVGNLLQLADRADSRLTPEAVLGGLWWYDWLDTIVAGERIGAWRVLGELGRGGMATVFLAERADGAFQQRAALKLLRATGAGEEALRRFAQERQILAALDHPSIARLLDGGVDEKGRPFIVMEYVAGRPIDRFCDERRLTVDQRLDLFIAVARAVLDAHRKGIIHRDLKPANILVTAGGEVKLLDFGIAKLLDGELAGPYTAPPTRTVARLMTPEYASPEQVRGEPVTAASDVYQLGALLYELLTGQRAHRLESVSLGEAERVICREAPQRPSAMVAPALARRLRGDLDDIVEKALRKEPAHRYPSPQQLIDDLERHRSGQPVTASRGALAYRTRKYLARHRLSLGATALLMLLVAGYALSTAMQARRIEREAAATERVKKIVVDLVAVSNPGNSKGAELTSRKLLDQALTRVESELAGEPLLRAEMLTALGNAYSSRGLFGQAAPLLEQALAIRRRPPQDPLAVAATARQLARNLHFMGRWGEAEPYYREALAIRRHLRGENAMETGESLLDLGSLLHSRGEAAAAEPLLRQALAIQLAISRPDDPDLGDPLRILGQAREDQGDRIEAERLYRRSVAVLRRGLGDEDPVVAMSQDSLGRLLVAKGARAEADAILSANLALRRRLYGASHPTLGMSLMSLGLLRQRQGRVAEARELFEQALAMETALFGAGYPLAREARGYLDALERR